MQLIAASNEHARGPFSGWRKSTHSFSNGNCAEIGQGDGTVGVRDSRLGERSPVLEFPAGAWTEFTARFR